MSPPPPPEEIAPLMRFIAEKSKNVTSPMNVTELCRQFQKNTGSLISVQGLKRRIVKSRFKIHKVNGFDNDTKVKMMFAVSAPIDDGFLNELRKQAEVQVDEQGRITKYRANDGSLKLEGSHGQKYIQRSMHSDRWQKACEKAEDNESEEEGDDDSNGQRSRENKRIDLVRFLIDRTKNATSPLSIKQLAKDYKEELKRSESQHAIYDRITRFRQHIHKMNQFDMPTKVRMMFALSASVDADFLQTLQKDAIVELDDELRIKKYKTKDGSLELEGDHSSSAKSKAAMAKSKKKKVANNSSDSEDSVISQHLEAIPKGRKRARQVSEDEESLKLEDDSEMDFNMKNAEDPLNYEEDTDYIPAERKPESLIEIKIEVPEEYNYGLIEPTFEVHTENLEIKQEESIEEKMSSMSCALRISLLEFLTHFRRPAIKYGIPFVANKINKEIKKLEKKDQQIPINTIIESLETCIQILKTPDGTHSDKVTISLSDFIDHLGLSMCYIAHPLMNELQRKLGKLVAAEEQKIPLEHIRCAMEETLNKILY